MSTNAKLTEGVLNIIRLNTVDEAMAPDTVSNSVYEYCYDHGISEERAEKIAAAAFELAFTLVSDADCDQYM